MSPPSLQRFAKNFEAHLRQQLPAGRSPLVGEVRRLTLQKGKRLRPYLCVLAYRGYGGAGDEILNLALALELFHTFALLQDDVMDEALLRRGEPTAYARWKKTHRRLGYKGDADHFGKSAAVLAGDLALMLSLESFLQARGLPGFDVALELFLAMQKEVLEGQLKDLEVAASRTLEEAKVLQMLVLKSGRYSVSRPLQIGAAAAGQTGDLAALGKLGETLGLAFQIRDDVLSLFGQATGKGIAEDIRQGKVSYVLLQALKQSSLRDRARLRRALGDRRLSAREVAWVRQRVHESGAPQAAAAKAESLLRRGLQQVEGLRMRAPAKKELEVLARFLVERHV